VQGSGTTGGPIEGYDISVYIVDDGNFTADTSTIWPACLPKADKEYVAGNRGILVGWNDPKPTRFAGDSVQDYANTYQVAHEAFMERQPTCSDPTWMKSNTYVRRIPLQCW
jgi:hypothetical protein